MKLDPNEPDKDKPDFRKLCEELVNAFSERHMHVAGEGDGYFCKVCYQAPAHSLHFRAGESTATQKAAQQDILTRAKEALK